MVACTNTGQCHCHVPLGATLFCGPIDNKHLTLFTILGSFGTRTALNVSVGVLQCSQRNHVIDDKAVHAVNCARAGLFYRRHNELVGNLPVDCSWTGESG
eukprot:TRINITY_DN9370_c0_g3_i2.p1 TRINITY_DN9370_c0_g3~~TRINITY_DN9370_c0_g3_i2.p1  ORF type:complete len:100 (-),score=8.66 TRINITY_DN9370_c0_g3_i2:45-344(-)